MLSKEERSNLLRLQQLAPDEGFGAALEFYQAALAYTPLLLEELRNREAQLRVAILVAWNVTLNMHGGVGYGEGVANEVKRAMIANLVNVLPEWAYDDDHVPLVPLPMRRSYRD